MGTPIIAAGLLVLAGVLYIVTRKMGRVWLRFRGQRVVTCPETQQPAGVAVDARHAAITAFGPAAGLRLKTCSRWPERQDCGQQCLRQIEDAPENCLLRNILIAWYEGKNCAVCGKPIGEIHWSDHKPGLLSPEKKTVEWGAVAPEKVPAVLGTHAPVCWNCHIVRTFCLEHPDLVVDRSRPAVR